MPGPYSNISHELPLSQESSVYPYNDVQQTIGGHIFEVDDTLGNERIKRTHTSGTFEELDATGGRTIVVHGKDYKLVIKDQDVTVGGNVNLVVHGECNTTVLGDYNLTVEGNMNTHVKGNSNRKIGGNDFVEASGDFAYNTGQNYKVIVEDDTIWKVKGSHDTTIHGKKSLLVHESNTTTVNAGQTSIVTGADVHFASEDITIGADILNFSSSGAANMHAEGHFNVVKGDINLADHLDVEGTAEVKGQIHTDASVLADVEVTAKTINLSTHVHGGVTSGSSSTATPTA